MVRMWLGYGSDVAWIRLGCGSDVARIWLGYGLDTAQMWLRCGSDVARTCFRMWQKNLAEVKGKRFPA